MLTYHPLLLTDWSGKVWALSFSWRKWGTLLINLKVRWVQELSSNMINQTISLVLVNFFVPWDAVLLQNGSGFLAFQLGNFDLAHPVLMALLQLHIAVSLVHEHQWVGHVILELHDDSLLLLDLVLQCVDLVWSGLDVVELLDLRLFLQLQVLLNLLLLVLSLQETILELIEREDSIGGRDLQN